MKAQSAAAAILALTVFGGSAFAQDEPPKVEYRKWDVGTTVGLLVSTKRDFGQAQYYNNEPFFIWNLDAGRFLTNHLKIDTSLVWTQSKSYYESTYTEPTYQYTGYTLRDVRPTTASAGLTYQFLENAFVHPYVTAGVRLTVLKEHRETYSYPTLPSGPGLVSTANDTSLQARPFGAFGVKSYFNERWFIRSELILAFDEHGVSHGIGRIGFGIDF